MREYIRISVAVLCTMFCMVLTGNAWGADDWYVSALGSGAKDGTTQATAWDGFANITWGVGGVVAGDTLYICGAIEGQLSPNTDGTAEANVYIDGACPGDAGSIDGTTNFAAFTTGNDDYYTIRNITLSGATGGVIYSPTNPLSGLTIDNVIINSAAINVRIGGVLTGLTITDSTFVSSAADTIQLSNTVNTSISGVSITSAANEGIQCTSCSGTLAISDTTIIDPAWNGIRLESVTATATIDDVTITGAGGSFTGLYMLNSDFTDLAITNSNFSNNGGSGVYSDGSDNWSISTSVVDSNTANGINLTGASDNITIQTSTISDNDVDGIFIQSTATDVTIKENVITANGVKTSLANGDGISVNDNGNTSISILSNIIYGNTVSGVATKATSSGVIYNNTIHNNGGKWTADGGSVDTTRGAIMNTGAGGWTIKNNIMSNNWPFVMLTSAAAIAANTMDNNLYYHVATDCTGTPNCFIDTDNDGTGNYQTLALAIAGDLSGQEANGLESDPLFTDADNNNFVQLNGSPAIDAGTGVGLATDFRGRLVPSGNGVDIGAYEKYRSLDARGMYGDFCPGDSSADIGAYTFHSFQEGRLPLHSDISGVLGCVNVREDLNKSWGSINDLTKRCLNDIQGNTWDINTALYNWGSL